jgi:hypothetical protein
VELVLVVLLVEVIEMVMQTPVLVVLTEVAEVVLAVPQHKLELLAVAVQSALYGQEVHVHSHQHQLARHNK